MKWLLQNDITTVVDLREEKGNRTKLADVSLFTFEPHISVSGSKYGYKRENIYYFDKEGLKEL